MTDSKNKDSQWINELTETQKIIPEHAKKIALAKMDLMEQWLEFRSTEIFSLNFNSEITPFLRGLFFGDYML